MAHSDLDRLYQDVLITHSQERHGYGLEPDPALDSHGINRSCGDEITMRVEQADGVIHSVCWTGQGCAISQASASMLSELMEGKPLEQTAECISAFRAMVQSLGKDKGSPELLGDAVSLSGVAVYPPRIKCAMLAWTTFEDALARPVAP